MKLLVGGREIDERNFVIGIGLDGAFKDRRRNHHREFRRQGSTGPAYTNIVAGGPGACILHYIENDRALVDGELVLIDAGAEWGFYAADVTRTFPVGGTFSATFDRPAGLLSGIQKVSDMLSKHFLHYEITSEGFEQISCKIAERVLVKTFRQIDIING